MLLKIHKQISKGLRNITTPFMSRIVSVWEMQVPALLEHAGIFLSIKISHSLTWYRSIRSMVVILRSSSTCSCPNLSIYTGRPILSVLWWKWGYNSFTASLSGNWKVCQTEQHQFQSKHRIWKCSRRALDVFYMCSRRSCCSQHVRFHSKDRS